MEWDWGRRIETVEYEGDLGAHRYSGFYTKGGQEWAIDYDDETQTVILVAHWEEFFPRAKELLESIKQQDGFDLGEFLECVNRACKGMHESIMKLRCGKRTYSRRRVGVTPGNTAIVIIRSNKLVAAGRGAFAIHMPRPNVAARLLVPTAGYGDDFCTREMTISVARAHLVIMHIDEEYGSDDCRAVLKGDTPFQDLRYALVGATKETVEPSTACCYVELYWQQAASSDKAVRWADDSGKSLASTSMPVQC